MTKTFWIFFLADLFLPGLFSGSQYIAPFLRLKIKSRQLCNQQLARETAYSCMSWPLASEAKRAVFYKNKETT